MIHLRIEQRLREAVAAILPEANLASVFVRPCPDPKFGDYQTNSLMALAKERKMNPRQLATDVLAKLDVKDICEKVEIADAGFLNFRLTAGAVNETLASAARGEHLFFAKASQPRTIVIDFSSPNVAKPMHVGHIRSTGIGDSLQRVLRLLGHNVISDNHIGDWGTQFGLLLYAWKNHPEWRRDEDLQRDAIGVMENLYKWANSAARADEEISSLESSADRRHAARAEARAQAKQELVKLQQGDAENIAIWREMIRLSQVQFDEIYQRLGVKFDHAFGESHYNSRLADLVNDLLTAKGIASQSQGAIVVFSDNKLPPKQDPFLVNRDGEWVPDPAIIHKSDGGFNYMTTDLATIDYRLEHWSPAEIVYVVDDRQAMHFRKLFMTFARWKPEAAAHVKLVHVGFGKILGDDGKPFKTRSGDTVKLADLLDEAEARALKVVTEKNPDLPEATCREIARVVGLGAVKYADLLPNRQSDYVFNWEKMLSLQGNTSPYLQYAYARIRSIFRKADVAASPGGTSSASPTNPPSDGDSRSSSLQLKAPEELALAKHLLNFGLTLEAVADDYRPNFLCNYLYELAGHFARFYEACPVLKAEASDRATRLTLCDVTARVLKQGLDTLGIEVLEQM
ncbi:MAG TPA: arginine--tRNA ligase [Verrucomicrobiae bacterium]|jgi:arginyl-tRNA synthetase